MAYLATNADVSLPVIMGSDLLEGTAVQVSISGAVNDLPKVIAATAGAVRNVFVVMAAVDDFSRPTDSAMYTAGWNTQIQFTSGYGDPVRSNKTYYMTGKSTLWNPTLASGERAVAHRGTTFAIPSGAYVQSTDIKTPGTRVKVGTGGLWEATTSDADTVGLVRKFIPTTDVVVILLEQ